jgi:uncharacterized membrane protein YvbJ
MVIFNIKKLENNIRNKTITVKQFILCLIFSVSIISCSTQSTRQKKLVQAIEHNDIKKLRKLFHSVWMLYYLPLWGKMSAGFGN